MVVNVGQLFMVRKDPRFVTFSARGGYVPCRETKFTGEAYDLVKPTEAVFMCAASEAECECFYKHKWVFAVVVKKTDVVTDARQGKRALHPLECVWVEVSDVEVV